MKPLATILAVALTSCLAQGAPRACVADRRSETEDPSSKISSRVEKSDSGGRTVIEEILVEAPVGAVWDAYATSKGWMAWVAPVAEVDLRVGGSIRTNYNANAKIGDPMPST